MKYYLVLIILIFFASCSGDDKTSQQKSDQDESDNPADTLLTPEEKFSAEILNDFLNESDDDDLADFLETAVYNISLGYSGISVVEISPALWFLSFEKDGVIKNYLLQKFMDISSNDYYFRMNETELTITDIISRNKNKTTNPE